MAITGGMLGAAHTTSTADDFVPELWSDGIYRYFERGTIFKNLVEDYVNNPSEFSGSLV